MGIPMGAQRARMKEKNTLTAHVGGACGGRTKTQLGFPCTRRCVPCSANESGQSVWVSLVGGRGCACSTKYVDCPCWGGMLRSRQNMARIHLVRASVCPGLQYMTVHCTLNTDPHLATPCPGVLLVSVWGDPSGGGG